MLTAVDNVIHTYLVPTITGAEFTVASAEPDQRRRLLKCLLTGDASRPAPLKHLAETVGMPDRKALGALLFEMQREGWISGEVEPMKLSQEPVCQTVEALLASISSEGKSVLSDHMGCCIATAGYQRREADKLAAYSAGLYGVNKRHQPESTIYKAGWAMAIGSGKTGLQIRHLHINTRVFHLIIQGEMIQSGDSFVQLVANLIRQSPGDNN